MKNSIVKRALGGAMLLTGALLTGCSMNRIDGVDAPRVHVESKPATGVYLRTPSLWEEEGQLVVTGNVARRMPYNGTMRVGHVHVAVWKDGKELDNHWEAWNPWSIPVRPPYLSHYTVRQEALPPEGAVVRVYVCNQDHPPAHSDTGSSS